MLKKIFSKLFIHFSVWSFAIITFFMVQVLLGLKNSGNYQPIQISLYLKYLALNLPWIVSLALPISGLFSASDVYISELLNKTTRQFFYSGKTATSKLSTFFAPATILGTFITLVCLLMTLLIIPTTNSGVKSLAFFMKTGTVSSNHAKSDREMSAYELLNQAHRLSLEITNAGQQQKTELKLKQNQFMVEVYKKFTLPLLGILLPLLGSILALILSKLHSGQRFLLFLFDIVILISIYFFLIAGESWGDRGILSPLAGMLLTPTFVAIIIVALIKRTSEILASGEASL
jgi:lipopolysaccharide export LptBFGC system permease protein LptF